MSISGLEFSLSYKVKYYFSQKSYYNVKIVQIKIKSNFKLHFRVKKWIKKQGKMPLFALILYLKCPSKAQHVALLEGGG
jgi:hypothetical protein